jgi:hypothetical protein
MSQRFGYYLLSPATLGIPWYTDVPRHVSPLAELLASRPSPNEGALQAFDNQLGSLLPEDGWKRLLLPLARYIVETDRQLQNHGEPIGAVPSALVATAFDLATGVRRSENRWHHFVLRSQVLDRMLWAFHSPDAGDVPSAYQEAIYPYPTSESVGRRNRRFTFDIDELLTTAWNVLVQDRFMKFDYDVALQQQGSVLSRERVLAPLDAADTGAEKGFATLHARLITSNFCAAALGLVALAQLVRITIL